MSINSTIRAALETMVQSVNSIVNTGSETEYIVFNCTELPDELGDNEPHAIRYLVQIHWFVPWRTESGAAINPNTKKKQIKRALLNADFTYPSTTNASDGEGQHFVFETEYCDGDV